MQSYQIKEQKQFMAKLLTEDTFDRFLLVEAFIRTFQDHTIDGRLHKEFFSTEDAEALPPDSFSNWQDNRALCFSIIKGKQAPLTFHFVLKMNAFDQENMLRNAEISVAPEQIDSFLVTIRYTDSKIICTTGTSLTTFIPDKSAEKYWDEAFGRFLLRKNIDYELL